ncbi:VWA domain-containing protein [Embleya hyalina]|uniref:Toxic cation resistance protein n=1 Tax=Embleya hyalina TaxID=516124 RepID=A0A401Z3G9_9ACTN|nr:VWA domain-containing protein [Embleya hyalina]GCE01391.1 toxic cation resistance protein [Embleya hyalina]
MGLRSLLRNVFRSRASRETAETPRATDAVAEPAARPASEPATAVEASTAAETNHTSEAPGTPEPEPVPEPPALTKPEPEPEPEPEPVRVHAPEPEPEPVVVAEAVVIPESRAESVAAEPAPVSIPVPAQSITTRDEAEPTEAEVVVTPTAEVESSPAEPEAPAAETESTPAATPTAVAPVPSARAEEPAPATSGRAEAAAAAVAKCGLTGRSVVVYLVLDRSGSMRSYYKDGTVQHLADQTLALSGQLGEAVVPLVFFSTDIDGVADLDPGNHVGRIEELHGSYGHMGRTNYHWAIARVVEHYRASGSTDPALVIFQTDGAPTSRPAAAKALCDAAGLPIFWQFLGFGDPESKGFDFLRKLDELAVPEQRVVDNAGFFHAGQDPRTLGDAELYDQLLLEFPEWLNEAIAAGVLAADPVDALV